MSDLQIGLLAVGILVVGGILVYNAVQERRARRAAEKAFRSTHDDVLLEGAGPRVEPRFEGLARRSPAAEVAPLPDARLDYVIELSLRRPLPAAEVAGRWAPFAHRFAGRALLAASLDRETWQPLESASDCVAVQAALQLASRAGPVAESELIEFRGAADTLAAHIGAAVAAPDTRQALESARALDELCAEADIQVVLHVVPQPGERLSADDAPAPAGHFSLERRDDGGFVLSLDVPRTPGVRRAYDAMVVYARDLCAARGGVIVDDNARALDERSLAAIGAQLDAVDEALESRGISPGGPAARRLFA